ncbi:MAG: deoxyguanosinetriphosphate triphosphohydrolase [Thiotrichales bacterium SG8_50]|nr:MAG: deoxyguanosinetriphosphate triphosphohydrolase [Thiotrichales bacterium SG8_50]
MNLASYAASDDQSRGRRYQESSPSYRSEYQRDRDRIVHSAAFRRLEYKTQVFVNHEGDLFRTRLTHSIEVAQIARSIARSLKLNEDLTEAVALAHDLGHTPFGHTGQDALNACMKEFGGFEHNLQSLRVVDELEERYAEFPGLNLTFEAREGILKHCSPKKASELGEVGARFIDKTQPGAEAQLVNLADEIAYNNHDVDDGLRYGLIDLEQLREIQLFAEQYDVVQKLYPDLVPRRRIHEIIRRMINRMVVDLVENSQRLISEAGVVSAADVRATSQPVIGYSEELRSQALELKRFLRNRLYNHYRVRRMSRKSAHIVEQLFEIFMDDIRMLPPQYQEKIEAGIDDTAGPNVWQARIIADYIAGMTDRYAMAEYGRLFSPETPV